MKKLSSKGQIHPIFSVLILGLLSVPMAFYGMYLYIAPSLPDMSSLQKAPLEQPLQIYTKDNILIGEFGDRLSLPVQYKDIPQDMIHAFLAAEDSAFFEHSGVSFKGLGRAVTESISGSAQTGGSTITMQVAKNYYLTPERTLRRKLTEIFLARKIEQSLSKEDILTLYVNKIFLGKNAYGIQAASKIYYGKTLSQLTLAEKAMIAGLPKAPSKYNPVANPERALERRNWILGRMLQLGYINQAQYETAIAEPIQLKLYNHRVEEKYPYLAELVRKELVDNFGEQIINSGFKVYTTVDSHRQELAEQAVQEGLENYDRRHGWRGAEAHDKPLKNFITFANMWPAKVTKVNANSFEAELKDGTKVTVPWSGMSWATLYRSADNPGPSASRASQIVKVNDIVRLRPNDNKTVWSLVQVPKVQGQLIALNPNNGAIEAIVGGFNFYQSKFNRAVQGWRQPGSTIKPFVYALALEQGMTPYTMVDDAPITIGRWSPRNSDGRYLGMIPLRRALYLSRNTVSVRMLQSVGIERTRQFLMDIGLHDKQIPSNYTIALGTPQVLPIQMATGYAAFANGGYRIQPYVIDHITDTTGKEIFKANPAYACIRCINQTNAQATIQDENNPQAASTDMAAASVEQATSSDQAANNVQQDNAAEISGQYRKAQQILKSSSAFDMANILRDVIQHGTGRAALRLGRSDLGGKTGTTNDAKDAWFAGFNGNLVAIAWVGFDSPSTLGRREYGGVAALPIWVNFMAGALKNQPYAWVKLDENANNLQQNIQNNSSDVAELKRQQQGVPPVARPIYKPAPLPSVTAPSRDRDFEDLPGEEILLPNNSQPPKLKTPSQNHSEQVHPDSIF
ncbi:PBP1A family penicillin-binding protein [Acinetobacter qingfengensis]|uniref:Penicillin-binding protein 1A n=1 Tax=Acinetobacter qingfengensis TaxID=1262585 RepID=A0A1E7R176_9GAMM|nr:PBP1A family penicillin-binding protein [Acinetobacter qingfengensis]KAA8733292.1 PBP1A family penicillin-binding protein [Acinetobacter qingfengensis]OEY93077.1 penicillin-binding protein [Acinetobacter qingfengensis]